MQREIFYARAVLAMLAAYLPGGESLREGIEQIPELAAAALKSEESVRRVAERYVHARDCVVLGRVFQYSTAREMALKLEETCYVVSTPFSTADFKHGPAVLIERGLPVIVFAPPGRTESDLLDLLSWLREQNADCLVIAEDERLLKLATTAIPLKMPSIQGVAELLAPIPYIIPGQILANYLALHKGLNPDQPRGLTKITRTR